MGSGGTEWEAEDQPSVARLNQKTVFVGTGAQISGLSTTYAGMEAFCTSTGSGFTVDTLYQRNAADSAWNIVSLSETDELNTTPVTDGADFTITAGHRYYAFFTLPTAKKLYLVTGIEWKNGAIVAGNIMCGIDMVDADPPTIASTPLAVIGQEVAQSGTSAVQRVSFQSARIQRGGTVMGVWVQGSSGSATLREETGLGSQNQQKATSYDASPDTNDSTAWTTATARKYLKVYYRGYG